MSASLRSKSAPVEKITLADIAAKAGVAVSTVSRVINGSQLVAKKKRRAVEAIIDEMGYKPAPLEKRKGVRKEPWPWLKHRLFKTILFGPHDLFWIINYAPVYAYALHGIDETFGSYQFQRTVERADNSSQLMSLLKAGGADGFLLLNTAHEALPVQVNDYPVVTLMGAHDHLCCDRIMTDPERAGVLAADYLRSKGCKFCVAIGSEGRLYRMRIKAFSEHLQSSGIKALELIDPSIVRGGPRMHQANRQAVINGLRPLIGSATRPIGIFSVADIVTPVIYGELVAAGFKIGHDAHIISCNGERPYLDALHPIPAVIDIQAEYIGSRAAQQIMRRLESPRAPHEKVLIEPRLILPNDN